MTTTRTNTKLYTKIDTKATALGADTMTKPSIDPLVQPGSASDQLAAEPGSPPQRLASIDAYRGLVMFLMMAEVLHFCEVAARLHGNWFWDFLCHHQSHVEWVGCSLHDLIQPSFSFLVGVALPFSLAGRRAREQSTVRMMSHAVWRSAILVFLGVFLRSRNSSQTNFTFEDTLSQIGLGYTFLFVLALFSTRVQWAALALILVGYWAALAIYPLPGTDFDYESAGVSADWPHNLSGFAAHWNKNTNLAWAFDRWFLNLLPRARPFLRNGGGYATLSFIPTLSTMILGLLAGETLRAPDRDGRRSSGSLVPARSASAPAGPWANWGSARSSSGSGRQAGCSIAAAGASWRWPASTSCSTAPACGSGPSRYA